jgi:hypothetical protein
MYRLLKNLNAPIFLNAAAAACGILQLSINSISDIRHRQISLKITVLFGIAGWILFAAGLICPDGSSAFFLISTLNLSKSGLTPALLFDLFAKLLAGLILITIWKVSRGGIGFGDILSLISLSLCCTFFTWFIAVMIGFMLAFFFAVLLFFRKIFRSGSHEARSFDFPFIPFLLFGFLLSLLVAKIN